MLSKMATVSLLVITIACSRGNQADLFANDAGTPQTPSEKIEQLAQAPVSAEECGKLYALVSDWNQELMAAINAGEAGCVQQVVEKGQVNVNIPHTVAGQSEKLYPLWQALTTSALFFARGDDGQSSFRVLKVLTDAGANLETKNQQGQTPLQYALEDDEVFSRYPQVSAFIIVSGKVRLQEHSANGELPIHSAIKRASLTHLQLLVERGVDINAKTKEGKSPLQLAIDLNFFEGVHYLTNKGALP